MQKQSTKPENAPRRASRPGKDVRNDASGRASARPTDDLAHRARQLRLAAGMTLRDLSHRSGISISTLSKLEKGQLSPTYDNIVRLANGLETDIASLFAIAPNPVPTGRRSITVAGQGAKHVTPNYVYEMLCTDLSRKCMVPAVVTVRKNEIQEFGPLISHDGEEFIYVLTGEILLYSSFYEPSRLKAGDCIYFDSQMEHGCISSGEHDAVVLWVVCSAERLNGLRLPPLQLGHLPE